MWYTICTTTTHWTTSKEIGQALYIKIIIYNYITTQPNSPYPLMPTLGEEKTEASQKCDFWIDISFKELANLRNTLRSWPVLSCKQIDNYIYKHEILNYENCCDRITTSKWKITYCKTWGGNRYITSTISFIIEKSPRISVSVMHSSKLGE